MLHIYTLHDHLLERLGSDRKHARIESRGPAIESCLLVNCFIEFSLVAARHTVSSDGKVLMASLLAIACRIWNDILR
jgi:hypothetical protein